VVAYYAHLRTSLITAAVVLVVGTLIKRLHAVYVTRRRHDDADDNV
jgi:hypothetical protein